MAVALPVELDLSRTTWLEDDITDNPDQKCHFEGNLCLIGDVKTDATLSAVGSILIWGKAAGKISAGLSSCPKTQIFVLFYNGAVFRLNGAEVILPPRLKHGATLKIWQENQDIKVDILKQKRFGIL